MTKYDLNPICGYEFIRTNDWKDESILFILHNKIDVPMKELSREESSRLEKFSNHIILNDYMFLLPEKYFLMSKNRLNKGQLAEAVIFAQIAIEVKIKRIYYYFLKNEGLTEANIIDTIENTAFMSMVKKEMSKRLGGIWDITKENSKIKEWYDRCYSIRNRVTHIGYIPTLLESELALKNARNFALYIGDLIRINKGKYPELMRNIEIEL